MTKVFEKNKTIDVKEQIKLNDRFDYFSLYEYIKKIEVDKDNLYHSEETTNDLTNYINKIKNYSDFAIKFFLIASFNEERIQSNLIERHNIHPLDISSDNVFLDTLNISHTRIKKLHNFAADGMGGYEYRESNAWVSNINKEGVETIYWYGASPNDIHRFLEDYIRIFKNHTNEYFTNNIFLRTALMHILFMRIHPFRDGNSRTSRIIGDMKFIDLVNRKYHMNLRISPLHISHSINLNLPTYYNTRNSISFNNIDDDTEDLNKWFRFILDMYDEQLFYMNNSLEENEIILNNAETLNNDEDFDKIAKLIRFKN